MAKDLFSCDLETLTFSDFEAFIDLGLEEGVRIDYKDQVPQAFADHVTSVSNTLGGLLLLGVRRSNRKPVEITGIERKPKSDLKTQLANKIASSIYPRPTFSIAVLPHGSKPSCDVAVVRVEPGAEPPYMFLPDRKVSIRVEDQSCAATLADLEELFRRRASGEDDDVFSHEDRDIFVNATVGDGNSSRAATYFRCWVWPSRPLPIRIDRRVEVMFRNSVARIFPDFHDISIDDRHANWVEVAHTSPTVQNLTARWRLTANGSIGFVFQPYRTDRRAVFLGNVVYDVARFLRGAVTMLQGMR